jgi:NAD(P)-dependent dehydrogenase (short-subunit alcohol dehydrogenase family)
MSMAPPPRTLEGKRAVVTGATGGLGPSVARALLDAGASVVVVGRSEAVLYSLVASLGDGARLASCAADVTTPAGAARAVEGGVDVLVCVAGTWAGGHVAEDAPDDELDRMLDANLRSAWFASRAALRQMKRAARGGRIVFVASMGGLSASPRSAAYGAAKAGVVSLTRSLAEEARAIGVTVNAVAPGTIATATNRGAMPHADASRWVAPEEVAAAIIFLASDAAAALTGAVVPVSRGG